MSLSNQGDGMTFHINGKCSAVLAQSTLLLSGRDDAI